VARELLDKYGKVCCIVDEVINEVRMGRRNGYPPCFSGQEDLVL
jgi:hypothetical protein